MAVVFRVVGSAQPLPSADSSHPSSSMTNGCRLRVFILSLWRRDHAFDREDLRPLRRDLERVAPLGGRATTTVFGGSFAPAFLESCTRCWLASPEPLPCARAFSFGFLQSGHSSKFSSSHSQAACDSPQVLQMHLVPSQRKHPRALIAASCAVSMLSFSVMALFSPGRGARVVRRLRFHPVGDGRHPGCLAGSLRVNVEDSLFSFRWVDQHPPPR